MLADTIWKADAILTHVAKVTIRVWLMVDCLKLKGKEDTLLSCYAVMHFFN